MSFISFILGGETVGERVGRVNALYGFYIFLFTTIPVMV